MGKMAKTTIAIVHGEMTSMMNWICLKGRPTPTLRIPPIKT